MELTWNDSRVCKSDMNQTLHVSILCHTMACVQVGKRGDNEKKVKRVVRVCVCVCVWGGGGGSI
jgi:hypothetical protein